LFGECVWFVSTEDEENEQMKKLIAMLVLSVLLSGVSMANANLWSEDFEGFNNNDDFVAVDPDWSKTVRWGLPAGATEASWINDDGTNNTANQDFSNWTQNGNSITDYRDLKGEAAVTGNTLTNIQYKFDVTSQSGVSYANRSFVHFDLYYNFDGTQEYEFLRVASDWNGFKLNDSVVLTHGLHNPYPLGTYIVDLDFSTQKATLQIDTSFGGGTYMTMDDSGGPVSLAKDFRSVGWAPNVDPGDITGAAVRLIYGDAGAHSRSATIQWDNMVLTPEPVTMLLLVAGSGLLVRRRR